MNTRNGVRVVIASLILAALPVVANAQPRIGFSVEFGPPPVSRYYMSLSRDYDVPYRDICVMHDAGVFDEDMPTILFIYTHSHYSLRQIYSLRLRGATWDNLSNWCGVPLYIDRGGPPRGNAYGFYRHGPGRSLDDRDGYHGKWRSGEHGRGRYHEDRDGDD